MTDPPTRLARRLGLADAVVIGLGSMIGAGVFAAVGPAADAAGAGLVIGLVIAAAVAYCNATSSAQLAAIYPASGGTYVYGSYADIDGLFGEQATEIDPKRREATLHRIQQLVHDKAIVAPIWLNAGLSGLGPRVEESGIGLIAGFAWSGPYEDVKLKGK